MQFNGSNGVPENENGITWFSGTPPRCKEPFNYRQQKVPASEGWFQDSFLIQRLFCCVPNQVKDEINDLGFGKDGTPRLYPSMGSKRFYGCGHLIADRKRKRVWENGLYLLKF